LPKERIKHSCRPEPRSGEAQEKLVFLGADKLCLACVEKQTGLRTSIKHLSQQSFSKSFLNYVLFPICMAGKDVFVKITTVLSILLYLLLILMSFVWQNTAFVPEMIIFIAVILFLYLTYEKWNLTLPIYTMVILGFLPHSLGFMGFYFSSPLPIAWDHFTHFVPCFAFALFFFQFLSQYMDKKLLTTKSIFLIFIVILAASGIGIVIELFEFSGFLIYGFGDGALAFGAGDACPGQLVSTIEEIDAYGGGWFNTMYDLIWNSIGVLFGVMLMSLFYYFKLSLEEKNEK
jgi:hypothetical protein